MIRQAPPVEPVFFAKPVLVHCHRMLCGFVRQKKTLHPEGPSVRALAKILRILCQALTFHAKRYNYVKVCHYLSR